MFAKHKQSRKKELCIKTPLSLLKNESKVMEFAKRKYAKVKTPHNWVSLSRFLVPEIPLIKILTKLNVSLFIEIFDKAHSIFNIFQLFRWLKVFAIFCHITAEVF